MILSSMMAPREISGVNKIMVGPTLLPCFISEKWNRLTVLSVVLVCAVAGCGTEPERLFDEIESPDGSYRLRVTVAEPRMPHGRFRVRAYLLTNGEKASQVVLDEKLENDGVPFTSQNLAVRWSGRRAVLVCLRTTDLPDLGFRIDIVGEVPQVGKIARC